MKTKSILFASLLIILTKLFSACHIVASPPASEPFNQITKTDINVIPNNIIQIEDTFEYYPTYAEGHLLCKVTGVRVVTNESQCPPKESFYGSDSLFAYSNNEMKQFRYEEWFTDGGAFDLGARIIMVDLEVTNVDAIAQLSDGTLSSDGLFNDTDAFYAHSCISVANLSHVYKWPDGRMVFEQGQPHSYFSHEEKYSQNLPDTPGNEAGAIQIPLGKTVSYTLGFPLWGTQEGTTQDLSKVWLMVMPGRQLGDVIIGDVEEVIFIDTELEG